jgi:hypothetical protein
LALKDLNVVGWEMLVQNLKETRLKQRDEWKKQIAQIHEAFAHFQNGANNCQQPLEAMSCNDCNHTETSSNCYWEVEYADILPTN